MRSNGPVATKELAMTGREWPGGQLASHIDLQRESRPQRYKPCLLPPRVFCKRVAPSRLVNRCRGGPANKCREMATSAIWKAM
jgi:hypothetical protein